MHVSSDFNVTSRSGLPAAGSPGLASLWWVASLRRVVGLGRVASPQWVMSMHGFGNGGHDVS